MKSAAETKGTAFHTAGLQVGSPLLQKAVDFKCFY